MKPGSLVGTGRTADVFVVDDTRVLRRYRDGLDATAEAAVMEHVVRHGFPAPVVFSAHGPDLVMQRLDGPTMLAALLEGRTSPGEAGLVLAELLNRLHALPTLSGSGADAVLHLDVHPDNVIVTPDGPVLIDWSNAQEGPADLDAAMSAVILAQASLDESLGVTAEALDTLSALLAGVDGDPVRQLPQALQLRADNPTMTAAEVARLGTVDTLVRRLSRRLR